MHSSLVVTLVLRCSLDLPISFISEVENKRERIWCRDLPIYASLLNAHRCSLKPFQNPHLLGPFTLSQPNLPHRGEVEKEKGDNIGSLNCLEERQDLHLAAFVSPLGEFPLQRFYPLLMEYFHLTSLAT